MLLLFAMNMFRNSLIIDFRVVVGGGWRGGGGGGGGGVVVDWGNVDELKRIEKAYQETMNHNSPSDMAILLGFYQSTK